MVTDPANIEAMISDLNRNMPVSRRTLEDYLENGDLTYCTRGGVKGSLNEAELHYIESNCTITEKLRLRIPIFVSTDTEHPDGAWKIEGRTEVAVMSKILGKRPHRDDFLQIYYPDLKEIRRILPDSVVVLFLP